MIKLLIALSLFTSFSAYSFSFYDHFKVEKETIRGVSYPQNYRVLYSGTSKKRLSLTDAINAMLKVKPVYFSSNAFVDTAICLMKRKKCKKKIINYWNPELIYLSSARRQYIIGLINLEKDLNNGPFETWDESILFAQKIMDSYFSWLGNRNLYNNFVKFRSTVTDTNVEVTNANSISWPSETVFTSTLSWTASLYGARTVVIREKNPRSLDLGYWNLLNSGYWYGTPRDNGEFVAAGYILGTDIIGYQTRIVTGGSFKPSKTKFGKRWQPEWHAIDMAFYLEETSEGPVVVVVRGEGNACVERISAFNYSYCRDSIQTLVKPKRLKKAMGDADLFDFLHKKIRNNPVSYPVRTYGIPSMVALFKITGTQTPSGFINYNRRGTLSKGERKWLNKKVIWQIDNSELIE